MCSAAWFVERFLSPGEIDRSPDAKVRGLVAHTALQRFYTQLPSAVPGAERVTPENLEQALALMRECVDGSVESGLRFDVTDVERRELLHSLRRDLEQLVRDEASSPSRFVPRKLEVSFSSYDIGDGVAVSGKIDRVDVDPLSARGIVMDYKSGRAPSATPDPRRGARPGAALHARPARPARPGARRWRLRPRRRWPPAARDRPERRRPGGRVRTRRLPRSRSGSPRRWSTRAPPRPSSRDGSGPATSGTTRVTANARPGAISGASAARSGRERARPRTHSSARRSMPVARSSSRPVRAPARRPCSSSGS